MLSIQPFAEQYRSAVIELWRQCGLVKPWNDPGKDINRKLHVNPELFLLALKQEELLGTIMGGYDGHRGWINYLAVAPNAQRNRLGSRLMQAMEEKLTAMGCPKINLQIRTSNQAVISFYQAIGYRTDEVVSMGKRLIED